MSIFDIESVTREPIYSMICRFVDNKKVPPTKFIDISTGRIVNQNVENTQIYVFREWYCIPDAYNNIEEAFDFCMKFFK